MTIRRFLTAIQHKLGIILRVLVSFLPRDKKLIVYGGTWDLFIDNAKHQFLLNNELMPDYKHVWLTNKDEVIEYMNKHHFNVVRSHSIRGLFSILHAGFVVYDDGIGYFSYHNLSMGAMRINIWHGVTAKMIGAPKKDEQYIMYKQKHWWQKYTMNHKKGDYCISTSEWQKRFYSCSFKIPEDRILIGGYPRNRVMLMEEKERVLYNQRYESDDFRSLYEKIQKDSRKKFVYMPTFRDKDTYYLSKAIPNWKQLNDNCRQNNITFYVKVHRVTPLPDMSGFSNIQLLDNKMDIYPLLPLFDRLITDYSSIMFDYSLTKKKVLLYTFDLEIYRNQSRRLYNHFMELLSNVSVVSDFSSFLHALNLPDNEIKPFPVDMYYDRPKDWQVVPSLIEKLS